MGYICIDWTIPLSYDFCTCQSLILSRGACTHAILKTLSATWVTHSSVAKCMRELHLQLAAAAGSLHPPRLLLMPPKCRDMRPFEYIYVYRSDPDEGCKHVQRVFILCIGERVCECVGLCLLCCVAFAITHAPTLERCEQQQQQPPYTQECVRGKNRVVPSRPVPLGRRFVAGRSGWNGKRRAGDE